MFQKVVISHGQGNQKHRFTVNLTYLRNDTMPFGNGFSIFFAHEKYTAKGVLSKIVASLKKCIGPHPNILDSQRYSLFSEILIAVRQYVLLSRINKFTANRSFSRRLLETRRFN
jgi:hypothetical protein